MQNQNIVKTDDDTFRDDEELAALDASDEETAAQTADVEIPVGKRAEMMQWVDEYIELHSGSQFGDFGAFKRSFSRTFKKSVRESFQIDEDIYNRVDISEQRTVNRALRLRSLTGLVFFAQSLIFCFIFATMVGGSGDIISNMAPAAMAERTGDIFFFAGLGAIVIVVSWTFRRIIRQHYLGEIETDVANLSSFVIAHLSRINEEVTNALDCADSDRNPRSEWPSRAGDWVSIALWHEERYREIDRYVTACAWRVENTFDYIERGFQTFNLAVVAAVLFYVYTLAEANTGLLQGENSVALIGLVLAYLLSALTWTFRGIARRLKFADFRKNSFWGDIFGESFAHFGAQKRHVFLKIAERVRRDKSDIIDLRRGGGDH